MQPAAMSRLYTGPVRHFERGYAALQRNPSPEKRIGMEGGSWLECTPDGLNGHIDRKHLTVAAVGRNGPTIFDTEVAQFLGYDITPAMEKAVTRMRRQDEEIAREVARVNSSPETRERSFTVHDYRLGLLTDIRYAQELGVSSIDPAEVEREFPELSDLRFDPSLQKDSSFYIHFLPFLVTH